MSDNQANPQQLTRYALEGRVVTTDASFTVLDKGTVYVDGGRIASVAPTGAPPPSGFHDAPVIGTRGTIYPGLIDLHNHLSYDALTLWRVPKLYTSRDQWGDHPDYRKLISGPMTVLGKTPGFVEAVVRYVECKCLLGGVTTAQGIALFSNQGITRYYRGVVRNVEETGEVDLPDAATKISDVEAGDAERFLERLKDSSCLLLHLSEGTDERAREHFEALRLADGNWAITPALAGIHCVALEPDDFGVLAENGGSMVWSPLSNLLLYGQTADVGAARERGVRIALGSDWSPSGSKSLLGELKVARIVADESDIDLPDRQLLAMATREAAKILKWDGALGSIEAGKRADFTIIYGRSTDPYAGLLEARETDIALVVIDGVPRVGNGRLMGSFGPVTERWRVGSADRALNFSQESADPVVGALTLREATDRLRDGLYRLPELARPLEGVTPGALADAGPEWSLVLDHEEPPDTAIRPHFSKGLAGESTALRLAEVMAARGPLSELLIPLRLDPLTVPDDSAFFGRLGEESNLPDYVSERLPGLF
jgi:cytosine/adenosine deaminase-related metal-dependent hydrolase